MATARATRSDAQRNHAAILDAAARLFASTDVVSLADVAEEAGVTRTTLYRHFSDRDALVDALIVHVASGVVPGLLDEIERLPLGEALTVLSHAVVTLAHEHRFLIAATAHRFDQAVRSAITDEPVTQLLRRHEQLVAPDVDLDWLARCVRSLCLVAISDTRPTAQVAGDLAASLRRLVLADPA
ncbi:TetR/AcrR family transcriptional regulator [uncultured Nocardioides sp.]|uniref:TetR/AcrR family transcriptional regulator n=1 Tax=uncultured Nocardioides sp. TaxID=198441 RepID=UPI000C558414|nr:TetR/AcrR family transcriptional regulator [uncultured Nocardioides sp.]MAO82054.1 hypothetical protein [Nocardioides sp.]